MKQPENVPKANKHRPKRGSTRTTRVALKSLLGDFSSVAERLSVRLEMIQRRQGKKDTRELWNTFEDVLVGQMALLAGLSALVEIQVDVKTAMGEN